MTHLSISLLGAIDIRIDGRQVHRAAHDKVCALLAYLVVERGALHRREALAELLWPDLPEGRGRHSLRQALVTLRHMLGDHDQQQSLLLATRESVRIHPEADYDLDIHAFEAHMHAVSECGCDHNLPCSTCIQHLEQAAQCYRGDFLKGVSVDASREFESWALDTRERLRSHYIATLDQLGAVRLQRAEYVQVAALARRQLEVDPLREEAHRQLMLALYRNGDRSAALAQFERCREILHDELDIGPDDETMALVDTIRTGAVPLARSRAPMVRLPAHSTPFIGRERELADVAALLSDPDCRLITVTGPGGAGKTRLAVEAVTRVSTSYPDGVVFVSLAGMNTRAAFVNAMVDVLFGSFVDQVDSEDALIGYVRDRTMLVVLDNFEQLVSESEFVSDLLEAAPGLQLVVTSRQRLDLHEQWIVDLGGLSHSDGSSLAQLLESDSARLFVESARRANSRLTLTEQDVEAVSRICELVNGMPLALELAAAWAPVLSYAEIAAEIEQSLDFLASSFRDVPDRHRSMRAVFDRSWELLAEPEREVFARLTVFRGGFGRRSAELVAGATLGMLSGLVNKSLAFRRDDDRFEVHELLRQYGEAKLWSMRLNHEETAERHCEYFCTLLSEHERSLRGHTQQASLQELGSEIENIRVAWGWAVEHGRADLLLKAAHGLWIFQEVKGRYDEADLLFGQAVNSLREMTNSDPCQEQVSLALASTLIRQGAVHVRLGNNQRGETLVDQGCTLARELDAVAILGLGLNFMGMFATERQDYAVAAAHLRESIEYFKQDGDLWGEYYSTNDLSMAVFRLGGVDEAEDLNDAAISMFTKIGDNRGLAFALHNRGVIASELGRNDEARSFLERALNVRRTLGHAWAVSVTLTQLAIVARATGDLAESRMHLLDALQIAKDVHALPAMLSALNEMAANLTDAGSTRESLQLLQAVMQHPSADAAIQSRARELLDAINGDTGAADASERPAEPEGIDRLVHNVLAVQSVVQAV